MSDTGLTLIETLLAVFIMTMAVSAMVGGTKPASCLKYGAAKATDTPINKMAIITVAIKNGFISLYMVLD